MRLARDRRGDFWEDFPRFLRVIEDFTQLVVFQPVIEDHGVRMRTLVKRATQGEDAELEAGSSTHVKTLVPMRVKTPVEAENIPNRRV